MHLKQIMKRSVAMVLILSLLLSLSACSTSEVLAGTLSMMGVSTTIVPGERLPNSAWINSDLEGSIDENTELNLKDDFHTTVNRDWFLENDVEGDDILDSFVEIDDALNDNIQQLLIAGNEFDPDPKVMSKETLSHLQNLVWDMMELAGNQEKRNELGTEPLRPYLDAIEQIDSMDEMTEYLKNKDNRNLTNEVLMNFYVSTPVNARDFYTVHIRHPEHILQEDFSDYTETNFISYNIYEHEKAAIEYVMGELGYTPRQIKKIIRNCYAFERSMATIAPQDGEISGNSNYAQRGNKIYTLDDIQQLQGNFPLTELLEAAGVAHSESFRLYEPGLLNYFGSYYKERNLDKFKAYFTVHTILEALPYLDETCQELGQGVMDAKNEKTIPDAPVEEEEAPDPETLEKDRMVHLYSNYITKLLYVPFQLTYIGSYCTSSAKENILNILEDIRAYYVELLGTTDLLGPETREKAIEKIEKMEFRVMYPDVMPDYSGLTYRNYDEGGNLLDAVAAINRINNAPATEKVNQPVKRTDWDLLSLPTIIPNAANEVSLNSIVILSGILAGDFMYDENAPIEQNYGRLGMILGHEVTHAFDTNGYLFDAEGLAYGWWTNEDEIAFQRKSDKLAAYYTNLSIYPGLAGSYNGQLVKTEAISDMGGIKCMLALAEDIPDFDYDLFFRSYASMWRRQTSITIEMESASDSHPLGFLRTNVTLQQFEKFFETYDIGPGDGMYLAPEDRILVW